jgi:hypothetical protein
LSEPLETRAKSRKEKYRNLLVLGGGFFIITLNWRRIDLDVMGSNLLLNLKVQDFGRTLNLLKSRKMLQSDNDVPSP